MINMNTNYKSLVNGTIRVSIKTSLWMLWPQPLNRNMTRTRRDPATLPEARPRLLPRRLENLPVRLHGNSNILGRPLHALISDPITSGKRSTAGKMTKGCRAACICPTPKTTKVGQPAGPNIIIIGRRSSRIRKSVNIKPMLPILPINQLEGTFP